MQAPVTTDFLEIDRLTDGEIVLQCTEKKPADPQKGYVPAYHFRILSPDGAEMGVCDLRVGYTESLYYGGHIGYRIAEQYRGNHYAGKAVKLLLGLAKRHGMDHLFITCVPENTASYRTCVWAGGRYLETAELPKDNEMRVNDGKTRVCVFRWDLEGGEP